MMTHEEYVAATGDTLSFDARKGQSAEQILAELKTWLEQQGLLEDKSSREWAEANGERDPQACYRSGSSFAYRNTQNFLTGANYV